MQVRVSRWRIPAFTSIFSWVFSSRLVLVLKYEQKASTRDLRVQKKDLSKSEYSHVWQYPLNFELTFILHSHYRQTLLKVINTTTQIENRFLIISGAHRRLRLVFSSSVGCLAKELDTWSSRSYSYLVRHRSNKYKFEHSNAERISTKNCRQRRRRITVEPLLVPLSLKKIVQSHRMTWMMVQVQMIVQHFTLASIRHSWERRINCPVEVFSRKRR